MRDGLVMFESPEDADRFASKLEEEGHSQVSMLAGWSLVVNPTLDLTLA